MLNLAVTLEGRGAFSDAAALYEQAARIVRSSLGPDHPRLAQVLRNWGVLLGNQQKTSEAVPLLREALRIRRAAFAGESRDVADALSVLGAALLRSNSFGEAEAISRQALTINLKLHGADDEAVAVSRKDLGALLCSTGRVSAGLAQLSEAAAFFTRHPSVEPTSAVIIRGAYGSCLTRARRFHEAEAELLRSYEDTLRLGDNPEWRVEAATRLATLYAAWNKPSEAMKFREATAPRGK